MRVKTYWVRRKLARQTLTFSLGMLQTIDMSSFGVQGLVLCPTRELAEQVADEVRKLGKRMPNLKVLTLYGGTAIGPQTNL